MPLLLKTQLDIAQSHAADPGSPHVSLNKYLYAVHCFKEFFHVHGVAQPANWGKMRVINWQSMLTMVGASNSTTHVTVYHALNGTDLVHGFRVVTVSSSNDITPFLDDTGKLPTHILDGDNIRALTTEEAALWPGWVTAYYTKVKVQRIGNAGNAIKSDLSMDHDPKAITFAWESEILKMMVVNQERYPAKVLQLALNNYAVFHTDSPERGFNGKDGFRHGLCLNSCYKNDDERYVELIDNDHYVLPYTHRGTNLGHLCPPRCRKTTEVGKL